MFHVCNRTQLLASFPCLEDAKSTYPAAIVEVAGETDDRPDQGQYIHNETVDRLGCMIHTSEFSACTDIEAWRSVGFQDYGIIFARFEDEYQILMRDTIVRFSR